MPPRTLAVTKRVALVLTVMVATALAACGGGGDPTQPAATGASTRGALISSRALKACLRRDGGPSTRVRRVGRALGLAVHDGFQVDYPNGSRLTVAVERTSGVAEDLQRTMQGLIVDLEVEETSMPDEPPAEMKARAAAIVHRTGNVVIVYGTPRNDEDAGVRRCLGAPR